MTDDVESQDQGPGVSSAAPSHCDNLADVVEPIEKALRILAPNNTPAQLLAAFDQRTNVHTIRNWRRGHRHVPPWAIALIKQKAAILIDAADRIKVGPGQSAGWRNVAGHVANR